MNMPGFTAEATLDKRSECYYQEAGDVVASSNRVLPARKIDIMDDKHARAYCRRIGALYMQEGETTFTYGCFNSRTGRGLFCGGDSDEAQRTCDIW